MSTVVINIDDSELSALKRNLLLRGAKAKMRVARRKMTNIAFLFLNGIRRKTMHRLKTSKK